MAKDKEDQFIISITRIDDVDTKSMTKRFAVTPKTSVASMFKQVDRKFNLAPSMAGYFLVYESDQGISFVRVSSEAYK